MAVIEASNVEFTVPRRKGEEMKKKDNDDNKSAGAATVQRFVGRRLSGLTDVSLLSIAMVILGAAVIVLGLAVISWTREFDQRLWALEGRAVATQATR